MVNTETVNARTSGLQHAHLCESFAFLGLIPHSKKPFKYIRGIAIHHNTAHLRVAAARAHRKSPNAINTKATP
jgi:hypothetical protein